MKGESAHDEMLYLLIQQPFEIQWVGSEQQVVWQAQEFHG